MKKNITILGDLNLDWAPESPLPLTFSTLSSNAQVWVPINEVVGGTAFNVAKFAIQENMSPFIIGKIGNDVSGKYIESEMNAFNMKYSVTTDRELKTGKTFIAWDSNSNENVRLLVVDYPNANINLDVEQVENNKGIISDSDYLFVSGYCLMNRDVIRFSATQRAIQIAKRSAKCRTVLDVVPHKIYELYSFKDYYDLVRDVDIIVSEVATIRRFLNLGNRDEKIDREMVEETTRLFSCYFSNFILRYGFTGSSHQTVFKDGKETNLFDDQELDKIPERGFSDHQTIKLLLKIY
jgi:sugar/nucleoside kinase (ribokinase family)